MERRSQPSTEAAPSLTPTRRDELLDMLRKMILIRRFEEKVAEMYTRAKIGGFVHLNIGEEASIVGMLAPLGADDYLFTSYRDHGYALARGSDPKAVMAELFGKVTGLSKGRGGSMHLFDASHRFYGGYAIVGGLIPIATGAGLAINYRDTDEVVMCVFGDGATNIGAFHEGLNVAKLWKLPVVFCCVNNLYGMGTAVGRASAVSEMWRKACAYDMYAQRVDGMDVLAVRDVAASAIRRAREEKEPTLLEMVAYRYRGHSMADPARYRTEEEVRWWKQRDPILGFENQLKEHKIATQQDVDAIEAEVAQVVAESVRFADESPVPDVADLGKYTYAESEGN